VLAAPRVLPSRLDVQMGIDVEQGYPCAGLLQLIASSTVQPGCSPI
jgi:hypothetical protein